MDEEKWISPVRRAAGAILLIGGVIAFAYFLTLPPLEQPTTPVPFPIVGLFLVYLALAVLAEIAMIADRRNIPINFWAVFAWIVFAFGAIAMVSLRRAPTSSFDLVGSGAAFFIGYVWLLSLFADWAFCKWDREAAIPQRQQRKNYMETYGVSKEQAEVLRIFMKNPQNKWPMGFHFFLAQQAGLGNVSDGLERLFVKWLKSKTK